MSPFRGRRTVRKTLLEEVQELEARAVDPRAAVLRDASGRRYVAKICFEIHFQPINELRLTFKMF